MKLLSIIVEVDWEKIGDDDPVFNNLLDSVRHGFQEVIDTLQDRHGIDLEIKED